MTQYCFDIVWNGWKYTVGEQLADATEIFSKLQMQDLVRYYLYSSTDSSMIGDGVATREEGQ